MPDQKKNFWSSIPGMLTGLAAVITAVTGLIVAINTSDINSLIKNGDSEVTTTDVSVIIDTSINEETIEVSPIKALPIAVIENTNSDPDAITLDALVDCKSFPTKNTITSLMSWSDYYHKQIINAGASKAACNKAIVYRAQAHCKKRNDLAIRQGLAETLSHCKKIKFSWKDTNAK